ncbi:hypothetical protein ONZ51_g9127 [Trametes cubensis]|uniref:SMC hinge domain-containing protein n=1 Tax=Trametes cubensis TaxID=1111947 RepID=A0AAD7TLX5_9APHY|nr:hypothetical protein ONZ51_g9127 [Trametes cubensis]
MRLSTPSTSILGLNYLEVLVSARLLTFGRTPATAEEEQCRVKLAMSEKELKALEARWKAVEREAGEGARQLEAMRADVERRKKKVAETGWSQEKDDAQQTAIREAKDEVQRLTEVRDKIRSRLGNLDFEYSSPYPNFDRNEVKGLVASLVSLDKTSYNAATALEITAGGRLYNMVVESDEVGKQLLQNGRLKRRVTLIPLNKIQSWTIPHPQVQAAERISGGKARPALSLIGYPEEVANAMAYVFGGTFVCDDAATAKRITFSQDAGIKSVTLDGDVYDPSGTLSGGSAPNSSGILVKVQDLLEAEGNLQDAIARQSALELEEKRTSDVRNHRFNLSRELTIKEHELNLLQAALQKHSVVVKTQHRELQTAVLELEQMEKDIASAEAHIEEARAGDALAKAERKLQEERATLSRYDEELKALEQVIKDKKTAINEATLSITQKEHDRIASLQRERTVAENQAANLEKQYEWIVEGPKRETSRNKRK